MRHVALLLMIFMAMAGMPAEASVIPGCLMVMPASTSAHTCCPPGACDCKIEIPRTQDLLMPDSVPEIRLHAQKIQHATENVLSPKQPQRQSSEAQESPPPTTPLYEKYSDYRI